MHEQGLGMKKDWHLAKRCYDSAAETSVDAKVPVSLALMKLSVMSTIETMKEVCSTSARLTNRFSPNFLYTLVQSPLRFLFELDKNIASNWDLYLITILTLILGTVMYFRRPPVQNAERYIPPRPAPVVAAAPSPPPNPAPDTNPPPAGTPPQPASATPAPPAAAPDNPDANQ